MTAKAIGSLLGAATVVALLIPGAGSAAAPGQHPASRGAKPETIESFQAPGSNGYTLNVTLVGGKRLVVAAEAKVGRGGSKQAIYTLPAPQSPNSADIKARIGGLGKIDVHFVLESKKEHSPNLRGCTGGESVLETGHFVGQISFRGEAGYTRVDASRAPGSVFTETPLRCKHAKTSPHEESAFEKEAAEAEAQSEEVKLNAVAGHGKVRFGADRAQTKVKGKTKSFTGFSAVSARRLGKIEEASIVLVLFAKDPTFAFPEPSFPTRAATVSPPAPFSGSATFTREPGKPATWSGDLAVELPGFGDVPLAGSGSKASMCQAPGCGGP